MRRRRVRPGRAAPARVGCGRRPPRGPAGPARPARRPPSTGVRAPGPATGSASTKWWASRSTRASSRVARGSRAAPIRACSRARRSAGRSPTSTSWTSAWVNRQLHGRRPSTTSPTATAESSAASASSAGVAGGLQQVEGHLAARHRGQLQHLAGARGSRASRVRSTSTTDGGTGTVSRCRSCAPTIQRDSSTTKNGLPPVRSCTAAASDRSPGAPSWAVSRASRRRRSRARSAAGRWPRARGPAGPGSRRPPRAAPPRRCGR